MLNQDNYSSIYYRLTKEGFKVIDVRQYYQTPQMIPHVEQLIATPWTIEGSAVFAFVVTDIDLSSERKLGYRKTLEHELWLYNPKNYRPVQPESLYPHGYQLLDGQGHVIPESDAFQIAGDFASAASYYPHVFTALEFAEARNFLHGRMGLPPVGRSDYESYLNHMEEQLRNNTIFTGKITTVSEMIQARQSIEDFKPDSFPK